MTEISCFGKSKLLCNSNQIRLYMDVFSGMFIVKIYWFHLMEDWGGGEGRRRNDRNWNFSAHHDEPFRKVLSTL